MDGQRVQRYRSQSFRLLENAYSQMRGGRWSQSEDLLWGSLTLAVKGVALSRGRHLEGEEAVRTYAVELGRERRDRRIRDAFTQLASFADAVERTRESRSRVDYLFVTLEDIRSAVDRLWQMVPESEDEPA